MYICKLGRWFLAAKLSSDVIDVLTCVSSEGFECIGCVYVCWGEGVCVCGRGETDAELDVE